MHVKRLESEDHHLFPLLLYKEQKQLRTETNAYKIGLKYETLDG